MEYDALTTRLTDEEIEEKANVLRSKLGLSASEVFNIADLLSSRVPGIVQGFELEILPAEALDNIEAFTAYDPPRIVVRRDVYDRAKKDNGRDRFTLAHELGHLVLHSGDVFPRAAMENQRNKLIPAKESTEGQAHRFGACLLMPRVVVNRHPDAKVLARVCKVSVQAAQFRLNDVERQRQRESVMRGFQELIAALKSQE